MIRASYVTGISVALIGLMTGAAMPLTARAQTPTTSAAAPEAKSVPAIAAKNLSLGLVAQKLSKSSGIAVVTDSSLAVTPVTFSTIGGSLDTVLTQLAATLPPGVVVRAALMPDNGGDVDGNAVATLLRAQDAFKPKLPTGATVSGDTAGKVAFTPGEFELMGQRVTLTQAAAQMAELHLKPVYVLLRQGAVLDPVAKINAMQAEAMKQWLSMTPEQRTQAAQIQFNSMMNMEPADRQAMLGQMMQQGAAMMQSMQQMPPEQRQQIMQEFAQAAMKSGLIPQGAGGPGGAGGRGGIKSPAAP